MSVRVKESAPTDVEHSTRLSSKNQLTVPVAVLRGTGLKAGDRVRVRATGPGRFEVTRRHSRLQDVVGTLPGFERDVDVEASRDSWER